MGKEEYFRLLLVLKDNNATTFNSNLIKIIEAVLSYGENAELSLGEIRNKIKKVFSLEFTCKELDSAIKFKGKDFIFATSDREAKFHLKPECYVKVKEKLKELCNENIFQDFVIECYPDEKIDVDKCSEIILGYFYYAFTEDVMVLQSLLQGNKNNYCIGDKQFSDDEKIIINRFLNWENSSKDDFVFTAITCGFDYCMLSTKKNNSFFRHMFSSKTFYLDTNIIFRLMGINDENRRESTSAFINKCKSAGIKIKYTNFTKGEIMSTIDAHVDMLRKTMGNNGPFNSSSIRSIEPRYHNIDFLEAYEKWIKMQHGEAGNYVDFKNHLKYLASNILNEMQQESHIDYRETRHKEMYEMLKNSLMECKIKRDKVANDSTVGIDVSNYMVLWEKYLNNGRSNVSDTNDYIITADHVYIKWAAELVPDAIPVIVLPSLWYSILLKYQGRSDDDVKSFTQFLNLRLSSENTEQKNVDELIKKIGELPETNDIQNKVLFCISQNIQQYTEANFTVEEMVMKAQNSIVDQLVKEQLAVKMHEKDVKKNSKSVEDELNARNKKTRDKIVEESEDETKKKWYFMRFLAITIPLLITIIILLIIRYLCAIMETNAVSFILSVASLLGGAKFIPGLFDKLWQWSDRGKIKKEYIERKCKYFDVEHSE